MLFKNLRLFRLVSPLTLTPEELHERLQVNAFAPCGNLIPQSSGWVPPLGRDGTLLTHTAAGATLICARKEERILPSSVIAQALAEKVAEIEKAENRPVRRKERLQLKDELIMTLLPKAFTKSSYTFAYINDGWLVVNAPGISRAAELIALLRVSLEDLRVRFAQVAESPADAMTSWVRGDRIPPGLQLGDECELKDPERDGGVAKTKRIDVLSDETRGHLDAGKRVSKLAITFDDRLSCVLGEDLAIKRLTFSDTVKEEMADADHDDRLAAFDAQFALMTLEIGRFLPRLTGWFGGLGKES